MNAMEGGRLAGSVACKAVHKDDASASVLREYETAWNRYFGKEQRRLHTLRQVIAHLSDEELNQPAHAIKGKKLEGKSTAGLVKLLLARHPKLLLRAGCRLLWPH